MVDEKRIMGIFLKHLGEAVKDALLAPPPPRFWVKRLEQTENAAKWDVDDGTPESREILFRHGYIEVEVVPSEPPSLK